MTDEELLAMWNSIHNQAIDKRMDKILERNPYLFDPEKDRIKWVRPRSPELWARLTNWAKLTKENDND